MGPKPPSQPPSAEVRAAALLEQEQEATQEHGLEIPYPAAEAAMEVLSSSMSSQDSFQEYFLHNYETFRDVIM